MFSLRLAWGGRLCSHDEKRTWANDRWAAEAAAETPQGAGAVSERAGAAAHGERAKETRGVRGVPEREAHGWWDCQEDLRGGSNVSHSAYKNIFLAS